MERAQTDGKSKASSDSPCPKAKAESCKKDLQHGRVNNKDSSHNKYHIRGTASQSTIEYTKCGESNKGNTGQRSKSFLEESVLSKIETAASGQANQCCKRGAQGSHGDGLFYPVPSCDGKRSASIDLADKSEDVHKKSQVLKAVPQTHSTGVITQRLFESPLSFADLVRQGPASQKGGDAQHPQLNNSLLSTPQGSTEVSNYLNKYRSYLDNLRRTYGKGTNRFRETKLHSTATIRPQLLPFPHMIHDIFDVTKDDPDFRQLLEKTTTESIRNLWPQTTPNRTQYNSVVCEFGQLGHGKPDHVNNGLGLDPTLRGDPQHQELIATGANSEENDARLKANESKTPGDSVKLNDNVNNTKDIGEGSSSETTEMKTCGDASAYQMGENIGSMNSTMARSGQAQLQPFRKANDTATMNRETSTLSMLSHQTNSCDWAEASKRSNSSCLSFKLQNQSALDNLLKHQQMLLQRKQLQNQQQHHHHHHHQQQQQQQEQQQQQQEIIAMPMKEKNQAGIFHTRSSSSFSNSNVSPLTSVMGQPTYSVGTVHPMAIPFPGTLESKMRSDANLPNAFGENLGHSQTANMTAGTTEAFIGQGARAGHRTLKASYACLDPSSPMTMMTKPVSDSEYAEGEDSFRFSSHNTSGERLTSEESQFSTGLYNADERCETAWALGKQYGLPVNQALPLERALSKARISTDSYDLGQQIPWSDSSATHHCSLVRMNSDSSLDCRAGSQNLSRHGDGTDGNPVCFNPINHKAGDHQMAMWPTYQQNVNTNRANTAAKELMDNGHDGTRADSSTFNDSNVFGSSRILQWRSPMSLDSDFVECQDKMAYSSRLGFQKMQHDDASAVPTGSLHQKARRNANSLGWNANVAVSQPPKVDAGNGLMSTVSQPQTNREEEGLFSYYQVQGSKLNYLFNNNNTSSDAVSHFQAPDSFSYLKTRGMQETSDYLSNPHSGCALFHNKSMVSESLDAVRGDNIMQESVTGGQDLPQKMPPVSRDATFSTSLPTDQQAQKTHDFMEGDKRLENHHESIQFNDEFPKTSTTSNFPMRHQRSDPQPTVSDFTSASDDHILNQLSENLDRTSLTNSQQFGTSSSPPWYELAPAPNEMEDFKVKLDNSKVLGFQKNLSYLTDQLPTMNHTPCSGTDGSGSDITTKCERDSFNCSESQNKSRPRMILGVNAPKSFTDTKRSNGSEDNNKKLREMLGMNPTDNDPTKGALLNEQPSSKLKNSDNGEASPPYQTLNNSAYPPSSLPHSYSGNQLPHFQLSGNRIPMNMSQQMQQMYCVSNILFPPPGQGHHPNLVSAPGVMTNVGSSSRLPHGMMRLPLVDMSRFVYLQPFPVNVTPPHSTNNNHNNSSSSNPHVNTSNIITINTSENDFSVNGDRSGRAPKAGGGRSKPGLNRVRPGTAEFQIPVYGMRPNDDAPMPKGTKVRTQNTNPWDQDLEHDFSSTYFSKIKKVEHANSNSELGFVYPEVMCSQQGNNSSGIADSRLGASPFMQWPMIPDKYPEMLDMLAVKKPMSDDCHNGRLCWPDMEFMMSSNKEQLQAVRKSNKPLGSNKANLISILPKGRANDSCDGRGKEGTCLEKGASGVK